MVIAKRRREMLVNPAKRVPFIVPSHNVAVDPTFRPGVFPEAPPLGDERVVLRRWSYDDLPCIEEAGRDLVIPRGTSVPTPFSDEAGRAFVERQWSRQTSGSGLSLAMVETATNTAAGMIGLVHRAEPGVVGVGYWTVMSRRRHGLTRRSISLFSRWALGVPGIDRIEALIEPDNVGSIRVAEGAGFRREGLLRKYLRTDTSRVDVFLYSLIPEDIA